MLICLLPKILCDLIVVAVFYEKLEHSSQAAVIFIDTLRLVANAYWIPDGQQHLSNLAADSSRFVLFDHVFLGSILRPRGVLIAVHLAEFSRRLHGDAELFFL